MAEVRKTNPAEDPGMKTPEQPEMFGKTRSGLGSDCQSSDVVGIFGRTWFASFRKLRPANSSDGESVKNGLYTTRSSLPVRNFSITKLAYSHPEVKTAFCWVRTIK